MYRFQKDSIVRNCNNLNDESNRLIDFVASMKKYNNDTEILSRIEAETETLVMTILRIRRLVASARIEE